MDFFSNLRGSGPVRGAYRCSLTYSFRSIRASLGANGEAAARAAGRGESHIGGADVCVRSADLIVRGQSLSESTPRTLDLAESILNRSVHMVAIIEIAGVSLYILRM